MKRYATLILAALAFAACHQTAEPDVVAGKVQIEPIITKATEVNFEAGDKIGLTVVAEGASENYATNECMTFAADVFTSDLEWYADVYTKADLYAYYPYSAEGVPTAYFAQLDQSEGIGAADFMSASKKGVLPTVNSVAMVFKHMMTKLVVNVDNQSGAEIESIAIGGSPRVTGLDLVNMTFKDYEGELIEEEAGPVVAYEASAGKVWLAIVIPHSESMNIVVTLSNKKVLTQPLAAMTLKSGGQYTINARVLPDNAIVSASGEIENWTDEGEIGFDGEGTTEELPVSFVEYDGYFEYDGVTYKTVKLADGNTWMAENLRFVPRGRTVSGDPAEDSGIWYPAANAEKTADPASVESLGLLYDAATAFGTSAVTLDNAGTFEGVQGICPTGWHIPTVADMTGLVGHCTNGDLTDTDGAYYDATIKGASLSVLKDAGWEWQFASMRNKSNTSGKGSYTVTNYDDIYGVMSYLIGSTMHNQPSTNDDGSLKNVQYYYLMPTYNASNEKVAVAYGNFLVGASLRCVKNK
ncbi:MAG: fimbrillin family protein [Bacteroidales bacterium]|nr:fimbrillin family protein [Bacteroidales bacterium]